MAKKWKRPQANGANKNPPATVPAEVPGAFKLKPAARYLGGLSVADGWGEQGGGREGAKACC